MKRKAEASGDLQRVEKSVRTTRSQGLELAKKESEENIWNATPALLRLPGEIRNAIWELVVIDDEEIIVDQSITSPRLLEVNRQIRKEAIATYYESNIFILTIVDLDILTSLPWLAIKNKYDTRPDEPHGKHSNIKLDFDFFAGYKWKNLVCWLEAIFAGKVGGPAEGRSDEEDGDFYAMRGVFKAVYGMIEAGVTWQQAWQVLPGFRQMLGAQNGEWLVDE